MDKKNNPTTEKFYDTSCDGVHRFFTPSRTRMRFPSTDDNKPWTNDDTIGITDRIVAFMYQLAQESYSTANGTDRPVLNDLLTRIREDKPVFEELCSDTIMATKWYDILIANRQIGVSAGELIAVVGDALEDILKLEDSTPSDDEDDISE